MIYTCLVYFSLATVCTIIGFDSDADADELSRLNLEVHIIRSAGIIMTLGNVCLSISKALPPLQ